MFECSGLRSADDVSSFQQKWHFYLRKPPFYPLNYGNTQREKIGRSPELGDQRSDFRMLDKKVEKPIADWSTPI
jgi:hypothetical protein